MIVLFSALPVIVTVLALVFGARSLVAALMGVAAAMMAILTAFPLPGATIVQAAWQWTPVLAEVLLIVGGGLLLSEVLRAAGGQAALAVWLRQRTAGGQGVGPVLLVVHGITPFAESLTGFGIGVTVGIPLLAYFGLSPVRIAVIGLLGLCAVPWGSMGPGTLIAATMAGVPFDDLGVASAVISAVPFTVTGMVAAWLAANPGERKGAVLAGLLSGLTLTLAVWSANMLFGTPPAGALGALVMIALHLARGARGAGAIAPEGQRALGAYGVLLGGVLAAGWAVRGLPEGWRYAASPALWLFLAAAWFSRGALPAEAARRAWGAWRQVAPVTGLFILLGVLMAVSGMAAHLAGWLAGAGRGYLAGAPFVGAMGGFVTGSNSGANAMFAATQGQIARALGVDVLWFMAIHNVAAAFLLMASPGKVEMAIQLAPGAGTDERRTVQRTMLAVALAVVTVLAGIGLLLGV